jgi:hypothetical protein
MSCCFCAITYIALTICQLFKDNNIYYGNVILKSKEPISKSSIIRLNSCPEVNFNFFKSHFKGFGDVTSSFHAES